MWRIDSLQHGLTSVSFRLMMKNCSRREDFISSLLFIGRFCRRTLPIFALANRYGASLSVFSLCNVGESPIPRLFLIRHPPSSSRRCRSIAVIRSFGSRFGRRVEVLGIGSALLIVGPGPFLFDCNDFAAEGTTSDPGRRVNVSRSFLACWHRALEQCTRK